VFLDGKLAKDAHGNDVDPDGNGTVSDQRTYQLIRHSGAITDRLFEVRSVRIATERICADMTPLAVRSSGDILCARSHTTALTPRPITSLESSGTRL
jgi:hypothetical protein